MNGINETCPLIMRDLYYYDIVAAFPTLMKRQFYDFKNVSIENKEERSKFVGIQQIDNPQLSSFLNESVKNLLDYYIRINEIKPEDIVFRQKDGFISTKKLLDNKNFVELKMRKMLSLLIIDPHRSALLYFDDFGDISVKGVPYQYKALEKLYSKIYNFNFYDSKLLMSQMEYLKQSILNATEENVSNYAIDRVVTRNDKKTYTEYTFLMKDNKSLTVKDMDYINPKKIDTWKYFRHYFKNFFDSIYLEVTRK